MKIKLFTYLFFIVGFGFAQTTLVESLPSNSRSIWQANSITKKNNLKATNTIKVDTAKHSTYINNTQSSSIKKKYILKNANVAYSNDVIETTPNNYVLIGQTYDTVGTQLLWHLTLTGIDQSYNQIWKKSYGNNNFIYSHEIFAPMHIIKKDNFLYSALFVFDSVNKQPGIFLKFNFTGDTIWQKKYYVNNDEFYITSVCPSVDNGFLITGAVQTNTPGYNNHPIVATYLLKTDAEGNKLWDKRFYKTNLDETQAGYKIIQDSITKKILIIGKQSTSTQYSNVQILDSLGNLITQKGSTGTFGTFLCDIIKLKDGNYVTVGVVAHPEVLINGDATGASLLVKFDINGNIILKKEYDTLVVNNFINNVIETPSNEFITGGTLSTLYQYGLGVNDISRIMKIDKNGNLIWKKYFDNFTTGGNLSNQDGLSGMILTTDGNIVFTNYLNNGNVPKPIPYILFKTDTTYCDVNAFACATFVGLKENELQKQKISVYPNPASNSCTLKLDGLGLFKLATIEVKNILGETIFKAKTNGNANYILNTVDYKEGLYFITISESNQVIAEEKLIIIK